MRSPALLRQSILTLGPADFTTITLDRAGRVNRPHVHESTTTLSNYPATLRQFIVTGLDRDAPTVIITNDTDSPAKTLIARYTRRMTIEQRLAEIIRAFHTAVLSSAVNLHVDLDIMLCLLAQALLAALRTRLPAYAGVTPDPLQLAIPANLRPDHHHPRHPSPCDSTDAPTHPPCAKPTYPTPPFPSGATAPCATNAPCTTDSPDLGARKRRDVVHDLSVVHDQVHGRTAARSTRRGSGQSRRRPSKTR